LPSKYVDLCYVTKCDLKTLKKRLEKRRYSKEKIRENLDAEILDVCLIEALENKHKVKVINTTKEIKI
jgi:adenylate kinase